MGAAEEPKDITYKSSVRVNEEAKRINLSSPATMKDMGLMDKLTAFVHAGKQKELFGKETGDKLLGKMQGNPFTTFALGAIVAELTWYLNQGDDETFFERLKGFATLAKPSDWKMLAAILGQLLVGVYVDSTLRERRVPRTY